MYNNNNNNNNNKCIKLLVINLLSYLSDDNRKCRQHITFFGDEVPSLRIRTCCVV